MNNEGSVHMYSAKAIANYFLDKGDEDGILMSPMKVIKLVYLAHGWYLAFTEKPLIEDYVEAWTYGPVIPSLYHEFKMWGSFPINGRAKERRGLKKVEATIEDKPENRSFPTIPFLDRIWTVYKKYTALELSALTHVEGTPWFTTMYESSYNGKGATIDDSRIRDYYVKRLEKH